MQSLSKQQAIEYLNLIIDKSNLIIEKFDAACMLIQVIGETSRKIDNWTSSYLFLNYPQVYWKGVFALRNIISHEYGNVDPENIFKIIKKHLPDLVTCIQIILTDLKANKYDNLFEVPLSDNY